MRNDTTRSWWEKLTSGGREIRNEFSGLYQCVKDEKPGIGVVYARTGDYSVIIEMKNPVEQYSADITAYYEAAEFFDALIRTLGEGYALQKQDIFYRQEFSYPDRTGMKYLANSYMDYFTGRPVTMQKTLLIITQEIRRSSFMLFDQRRWDDFWNKLEKVRDILNSRNIHYHIYDSCEIIDYLTRYLAVEFKEGAFSFDNFKVRENYIKNGSRIMKMVDLVDIDEVIMPATVKPYAMDGDLPVDLFSFLAKVPNGDCVIYTQNVIIPPQRKERAKLSKNYNHKNNFPDPANAAAARDIKELMDDLAVNNKMIVYTHFSVLIVAYGGNEKMLDAPFNFVERRFYDLGFGISKTAYNQLELFINSFPGNSFMLQDYNRFICLSDAVSCFLFKERIKESEDTPLKVFYTDRDGKPVAIDITGKEGVCKFTTNSNFFALGPSGSGKSFHMNSVVRQLYEQDTDIILVDTGNSYEGLCDTVGGKYISYTEESPITMNPFLITREERNIEKMNFLKSLVLMIWKGAEGTMEKKDEDIMDAVLSSYYDFYFTPFDHFPEKEYTDLKNLLMIEARAQSRDDLSETEQERIDRERIRDKVKKLELLAEKGEGGEASNARALVRTILDEHGITMSELDSPETRIEKVVERRIKIYEEKLSRIRVTELSFNSFFEFCQQFIPIHCEMNQITFDLINFRYALLKFYKGGAREKTLNDNMDASLFDKRFIVFEIDSIKDDKLLFPIVTLIIMDLFIQKMRLKKCRKALIIEEAWKAISSPVMEEYIKYLYKTVRKWWGIVGLVTQDVQDLVASPVIKNTILSNSDITILLDQSKFRDNYSAIAALMGLTEVDQRKIWTINRMDNHDGRSFFKEVFIRRGTQSDVLGVEECPQSYMAYTTERIEKDALKVYLQRFGSYDVGNSRFCYDWEKVTGRLSKADKFASFVNRTVRLYAKEAENEKAGIAQLIRDWSDYEATAPEGDNFFKLMNKKNKVWSKWE